jgi:hypothetical protein
MCRGKGLSQTFKCQYVGYLYKKFEIERSLIMWKYKPAIVSRGYVLEKSCEWCIQDV